MKKEVIIAGFGGQGILLMGRLLAEAAMNDGYHATWFPSYGPEMRGGTANCMTIFSDEEIGSPIAAQYDVVIAMNQPSLERFEPRVRAGGVLLVNSSMVPIKSDRRDVSAVYIPAVSIAGQLAQEKVANVVMLGALLAVCPTPQVSAYEQAIGSLIGLKKPDLVKINLAALHAGRQAAMRDGAVAA
jgi:2-oxoglutarate ferredoxin oxidoreductase subunit gamma